MFQRFRLSFIICKMHLMTAMMLIAIILQFCMSADEVIGSREITRDYCQYEIFQPRCLKNEVVVMVSATYGRMRIGRCITTEEMEDQKHLSGDNSRILGCSADVLSILDKKCSGRTECDVRLSDIAAENIKPCFRGLVMYLEVSYECLNVVDDKRSCSVSASKNPIHIIISSESPANCGSKFQPWIVESPVGQKVSLGLLDFTTLHSIETRDASVPCNSRGVILDKAGRRNVSICANGVHRSADLYKSEGNRIEVLINPTEPQKSSQENYVMLSFKAVGCSDIIPPEDTWLKRNNDRIEIGCYSSRQTWQLNCREGKWVGVLGNCSQRFISHESGVESEVSPPISSEEQVLAMVAISGCTLAICLAIMCIGAVCLRRFYVQSKSRQDYKTLNCTMNSARSRFVGQTTSTAIFTGNDVYAAADVQTAPNNLVFVGETDLNPMRNSHVAHSGYVE